MRSFLQIETPTDVPQILTLVDRGVAYRFNVLHVSREEHRREAGPRVRRSEHAHNVYHIVLFTRGQNRFMLEGVPRLLRPGTLALTGPGMAHNFSCCDPGTLTYLELTFALCGAAQDCRLPFHRVLGLYAGMDLPELEMPLELSPEPRRVLSGRLALLLTQLAPGGRIRWLPAFRTILELLLFLAEDVYGGESAPADRPFGPLDEAKRRIDQRFAERLSVDDLAAEAHLSRGYFLRAFKARFGLPPIAYQQTVRVNAAKTLLRNTNLLCKEIAVRTGFEDVYYFSKVFKKVAGMTPTAFRKGA